jgi:hypothetical protein
MAFCVNRTKPSRHSSDEATCRSLKSAINTSSIHAGQRLAAGDRDFGPEATANRRADQLAEFSVRPGIFQAVGDLNLLGLFGLIEAELQ